jgi:hypothetical protein
LVQWERGDVGEEEEGKMVNKVQQNVYLLRQFQELGEGTNESHEVVNSSMIYLIRCKNLCKCHNVPPSSTTKEKKKHWGRGLSCRVAA